MLLNEFITQSINQIFEGINAANTQYSGEKEALLPPKINFDVLLNVNTETAGGGGIEVFGIKAGAEKSQNIENSHRIAFEIPLKDIEKDRERHQSNVRAQQNYSKNLSGV